MVGCTNSGCSPVGTVATAHACMVIKSFVALGSDSVELPYWKDIIRQPLTIFKDGYAHIPDEPGLGIDLNEDICRAHIKGKDFFD